MKIGNLSTAEFDRTVTKFAGTAYIGKPFSARREGLDISNHLEKARRVSSEKNIVSEALTGYVPFCGDIVLRRAVNKALCCGINPKQAVVSLVFPSDYIEKDMRPYITCISKAAESEAVSLSEIAVKRQEIKWPEIMVSITGDKIEANIIDSDIVKKHYIVCAGTAAEDGAIILRELFAKHFEEIYPKHFLDTNRLKNQVCLSKPLKEILAVCGKEIENQKSEAATNLLEYALPIGEGGVFGALWELSEQTHLGMNIDLKSIKIDPLTVEICETIDVTPYSIMGKGVLLISQEPEYLLDIFDKYSIKAEIIGELNKTVDKLIINEDETRYLESFKEDALVSYIKRNQDGN